MRFGQGAFPGVLNMPSSVSDRTSSPAERYESSANHLNLFYSSLAASYSLHPRHCPIETDYECLEPT